MIIAVIGYKLGCKNLSVNYDTMNKKYFVCSEDFFCYVKSKKQVRNTIAEFKKSYNN